MKKSVEAGQRIRTARLQAGLSGAEVERALGIKTAYLNHYEAGRVGIPEDKLEPIAKILGVTIEYIVNGPTQHEKQEHHYTVEEEKKPAKTEAYANHTPPEKGATEGPYIVFMPFGESGAYKPKSYDSLDAINDDITNGTLLLGATLITRKLKLQMMVVE